MHINTHALSDCRQVTSPNCNDRPAETDISLIVIHGISLPPGRYEGDYIDQLFCNCLSPNDDPYFKEICHLKVSSHLLIRRDGELVQYVPFNKRAWHAGKSAFNGNENCNDFSIGIELEGDDVTAYELIQYQRLAEITALLLSAYPGIRGQWPGHEGRVRNARIVGHSDIAPERKTDPGPAFDWFTYENCLMRG